MKGKKETAKLLAMVMLLSTMTGCGSTEPAVETTSETVPEESIPETETVFTDGLPDVDCEGKIYRMVVQEGMAYDIVAEELTGEIENDVIYERNAKIAERFHTEIETVEFSEDPRVAYNTLVQTVTAGDTIAETVSFEVWVFHTAVSGGIYQNWLDTEYIQLDKPWWNQKINEGATFNDNLLGLIGWYTTTYMTCLNAIYFNPVLLEKNSIALDSLYDTVNAGEWTIDSLSSMVAGLYQDVNGNGERDLEADIFGYGAPSSSRYDVWPAAFDIDITGKDEDGKITVEFLQEKTYNALEKVYALFHENEGGLKFPEHGSQNNQYFLNGQFVFLQGTLSSAFGTFRDMEDSFGLLPIPKYDETQDTYHCLVGDGCSILGLPTTVTDTEFASLITEALCAETWYSVYPAYYDVALKSKYSLDENTAAMVDYIADGAAFDVSFMYGVYLDMLPYMFRECVMEGSTDLASRYASIQESVEAKLEILYEMYQ